MDAHTTHEPAGSSAGHGTETEHPHNPPYLLIWVVLLVLTLAEVGYAMAFQESLPKGIYIIGLLLMAVWKAVLVALYYMHLRWEPRRMWILATSPLPLVAILILTVMMEY
jgi:cytochrome c oxidase subunit 4